MLSPEQGPKKTDYGKRHFEPTEAEIEARARRISRQEGMPIREALPIAREQLTTKANARLESLTEEETEKKLETKLPNLGA